MINNNAYFASSNSARGFQSYFDLIYKPSNFKKIYIIKGGPGTGKSTLIKRVGEEFEKKIQVEYFICSSDPDSYDGAIVNENIALIDGTSPHIVEAKYPGAVEVIVDSAVGINSDIMEEKEKIISMIDKKAFLYRTAYSYLASAGQIKSEYTKMVSSNFSEEKLDAAISRFFKQNINRGEKFSEKIRLINAITPHGVVSSGAFENRAKRKCIIVNGFGFENLIYKKILEKAREYQARVLISFDPLTPYAVDGIYFLDDELSVTSYSSTKHGEIDYDKYKVINCERFLDKNTLSQNKSKLKFSHKCQTSLIDEAVLYLKEASKVHAELEKIYKQNMDYSRLTQYFDYITNEIKDMT